MARSPSAAVRSTADMHRPYLNVVACRFKSERRRLIRAAIAAGIVACLMPGASPAGAEVARQKRPNVLFIVCDDLNHYVLHGKDSPQAKTPNIDRLAKHSVTFANNHAVTPVCGPSRTCFWTGVYPQWQSNYNVGK